jgi:hypothetical protein
MKAWLTELRISNALDDANPAHEQAVPPGNDSGEVRQFEETARSLDRRLKAARPRQQVPPGLHAAVMCAVRSAAGTQELESGPTLLRWLPAPALALLVVGGLWWALNRSEPEPQPLTTAADALERSHQLTQQAPAAVLAPLSKEMESLNRDFRNAVEFLVASVP